MIKLLDILKEIKITPNTGKLKLKYYKDNQYADPLYNPLRAIFFMKQPSGDFMSEYYYSNQIEEYIKNSFERKHFTKYELINSNFGITIKIPKEYIEIIK